MNLYEDSVIVVDAEALTIRSYRRPGRERRILLSEVRSVELITLGFWSGRLRPVGIGPGGPPPLTCPQDGRPLATDEVNQVARAVVLQSHNEGIPRLKAE